MKRALTIAVSLMLLAGLHLIVLGEILIIPFAANAEIVHGFGHCGLGGWDFSDSAAVDLYEGDLSIVYVVDPPIGYWMSATNGAAVTMVSDSTLEELTTAPQDPSLYDIFLPALLMETYVIRTVEGYYAKFRIFLYLPAPTFEYYYQPNGSRVLPVEQSSWGQIKALYR